jgi:hypothetical protein
MAKKDLLALGAREVVEGVHDWPPFVVLAGARAGAGVPVATRSVVECCPGKAGTEVSVGTGGGPPIGATSATDTDARRTRADSEWTTWPAASHRGEKGRRHWLLDSGLRIVRGVILRPSPDVFFVA